MVPSIVTARNPASHVPAAPGSGSGPATRPNSTLNGSAPSRARARLIADTLGGSQDLAQRERQDRPFSSRRMTSS